MIKHSVNNFLNRKYYRTITWILLIGLSAHFIVFHHMFESSVLCLDDDGASAIEYSTDGNNCIPHQDNDTDYQSYFSGDQNGNCEDISFSDTIDDDQFVIKKVKEELTLTGVVCYSFCDNEFNNPHFNCAHDLITTQSTSLCLFKTVSLLI